MVYSKCTIQGIFMHLTYYTPIPLPLPKLIKYLLSYAVFEVDAGRVHVRVEFIPTRCTPSSRAVKDVLLRPRYCSILCLWLHLSTAV